MPKFSQLTAYQPEDLCKALIDTHAMPVADLRAALIQAVGHIADLSARLAELEARLPKRTPRRYHPDGADITGEAGAHIAEHYHLEPNDGGDR